MLSVTAVRSGVIALITRLTFTISKRGWDQAQNYPAPPLHTCCIIQSVFTREDLTDRKINTLSPFVLTMITNLRLFPQEIYIDAYMGVCAYLTVQLQILSNYLV